MKRLLQGGQVAFLFQLDGAGVRGEVHVGVGEKRLLQQSQWSLAILDTFQKRWISSNANARPRGERFAATRSRFQVETSHSGPGTRPEGSGSASGGSVLEGGLAGMESSTATYRHRLPRCSMDSRA